MISLFMFSCEGCYGSVEKPQGKIRVPGGRCCGASGKLPAEMEEGQQEERFPIPFPEGGGSAAKGDESREEASTSIPGEAWMARDGRESPFLLLPNSCSGI